MFKRIVLRVEASDLLKVAQAEIKTLEQKLKNAAAPSTRWEFTKKLAEAQKKVRKLKGIKPGNGPRPSKATFATLSHIIEENLSALSNWQEKFETETNSAKKEQYKANVTKVESYLADIQKQWLDAMSKT